MQEAESSNAVRVVHVERRRKRDWVRTWGPVAALVAAIAGGAPFVFAAINWPWEGKAEAKQAHEELQAGIDAVRDEQRAGNQAVIEAIHKLGERLERKKGK